MLFTSWNRNIFFVPASKISIQHKVRIDIAFISFGSKTFVATGGDGVAIVAAATVVVSVVVDILVL